MSEDNSGISKLSPIGYRPRVVDARLDRLLHAFGGVEVTGPKWCGKTWTAMAHANSVDSLMDDATLTAAETDPALVLLGDEPHLIDEWQEVPQIWDKVRDRIDDNANRKGQFILTGSSAPKDEGKIRHSGTGRIARMRMRPMTLFESGDTLGGVSFANLFEGSFVSTRCKTEVHDVARWCCRGGWPSIIGLDDEFALETPAEYVKSVLDINVRKLGGDPSTALALMRALAFNVSQAVTYKTLAKDMRADDEPEKARATIESYMHVLESLYIVEDLEGWAPPLRAKNRVRVKPKRYFVDPSLPATLMGATPGSLMRDMQTLGNLFETLCLRDLRTYLSVLPGAVNKICYYRDEKGLVVDIIVELSDGRWGAFEVKLSDSKVDEGSAGELLDFRKKMVENPATRTRNPEFLAFLVGKGDIAYQRDDGIYVIPITTLEP